MDHDWIDTPRGLTDLEPVDAPKSVPDKMSTPGTFHNINVLYTSLVESYGFCQCALMTVEGTALNDMSLLRQSAG